MDAAYALAQAFRDRADGIEAAKAPLVGTYGHTIPRAALVASGAVCADIKAPPLADDDAGPVDATVAGLVERFVDDFATRFLHRFAAGAFDRFALLIFSRDDASAFLAYQYAREMRRQGLVPENGPVLFLWNIVPADTPAARRFNAVEWGLLDAALVRLGASLSDAALARAVADERQRAAALAALADHPDVFTFHLAGQWLDARAHADLLAQIDPAPVPVLPKIGLVGTACDLPVMHDICAGLGHVVADLQPYGARPGAPAAKTDDTLSLIRELAQDPLNLRVMPASRFGAALDAGLADCDLVVAAYDRADNAFGWEIPRLRQAAAARGARFLDLGFRPFRPDAAWRDDARAKIEEALA